MDGEREEFGVKNVKVKEKMSQIDKVLFF